MQEQPLQSDPLAQPLVRFGTAVLVVIGDRAPQMLGTLAGYAQMTGVVYHLPAQ